MGIRLDSRVVRSNDHISSEVAGETVVLHLETGQYYSLNETASAIWKRLDSPINVQELVKLELEEFDAEPAEVERNIIALLNTMLQEHLVRAEYD